MESLLWEKALGEVSEEESGRLQKHLSECENCQSAFGTIKAVLESKSANIDTVNGVDTGIFDDEVFQKIRAKESEFRLVRKNKGYMFRMYGSMALAAAIVAFMLMSISDLERYTFPISIKGKQIITAKKEYDTIHIKLTGENADEQPADLPSEIIKETIDKSDKNVMALSPATESAQSTETPLRGISMPPDLEEEIKLETKANNKHETYLVSVPEQEKTPDYYSGNELISEKGDVLEMSKKKALGRTEAENPGEFSTSTGEFSILANPVSNPSPDSVIINSIYLSDEAIPIVSQQTRAFLPEVVVDSGMIQTLKTPRSVLVTVEKMPVPLKIIPPEYPVWARKNGVSGAVWIKARVDEKGNVDNAEIMSSNMRGFGFEEAALEAAKLCKYYPAEANGIKIPIWVIYPVNFVYKK